MDEIDQRRLPQDFRRAFVVILHDRRADCLCSANPAANAHQDHQVLIAVRLHRCFHFVLRCFEFFLKRVPLIVFRELVDAVTAAEHVLAHAERLRQLNNIGADVFDLLTVFRFHRDESVRD